MIQLIDAEPATEILGISKARLYQLCRMNIIPHVRIGRQIRFNVEHLENWINSGGTTFPNSKRKEG